MASENGGKSRLDLSDSDLQIQAIRESTRKMTEAVASLVQTIRDLIDRIPPENLKPA